MKKVFVTGITGLLGANVVIKLLEDGYFVIALVRKKSNYLGEKNKSLKLIEGDLFSDFSEYLKDVNFIIHIAAETKQNLLNYEDYRKVNYEGVVHLLSQSVNAEKFLFVSTANTLGFGSLDDLGTENDQWKYPFNESFYAKSKLEAENFLLENNKAKVIIVNPTFMIGAYDNKPSSGKIIFWVWKKKLVFYPKGGKNFVNAEDAAKGICKALEKGKPGEKYLLANENLKYKDFFKIVNNVTGQQSVLLPVPDFILIFFGFIGDFLRLIKIKTNLSSANMKALRIDNFYSNQKSINELGVHYQPIEKGITDAVEYFKNTIK
ncbi:NAD-dependent epimerase/dehydratase family protein [Chryseobacterium sp.]|uniref:NAD-dependent epimerase/dehydratase family protein n=1 Tax=Chryseobacterium sp. TaxID=1871047 RepID=UPI0012C8B192|nr:NAD-dependent epimerase/dehydratase family protein [Chryseobacterium sp.]MPS64262.1 NAD-dependent epimerase/dehydratase family protein [Chryseobacterium sp.]